MIKTGVICSTHTEWATRASVLSLKRHNPEWDIEIHADEDYVWLADLPAKVVVTGKISHPAKLERFLLASQSDFVAFVDSDVTFHEPILDEMVSMISGDIIGVGLNCPADVKQQLGIFDHLSGHPWHKQGFILSPRPTPWLLAFKACKPVIDACKKVGFHQALIDSAGAHGLAFDVLGLWAFVLEAAGYRFDYIASNDRAFHWQSVSWLGGRYRDCLPYFMEIAKECQ